MSIPSRVLISSNISHMTLRTEDTQCQSLQGFSYHLTLYKIDNDTWFKVSIPSRVLISSNMLINLLNDKKKSTVSIPSRVLISSNNCINLFSADLISVSIPSRVLISSNEKMFDDSYRLPNVCQSLQGFSYHLTPSLQSRYLSMLIYHFAGQIHFSLYLPITTYTKMPFSPVFMLCAADFTKYTSIMFSMSINLTIILYIMQVLLATV